MISEKCPWCETKESTKGLTSIRTCNGCGFWWLDETSSPLTSVLTWIPVSERLPEDLRWVLVATRGKDRGIKVRAGYFHPKTANWCCAAEEIALDDDVLLWAEMPPLPPPASEEEEG